MALPTHLKSSKHDGTIFDSHLNGLTYVDGLYDTRTSVVMTQLPPQIPPRPEQTPQTAQGTVASEESLTRNRFSTTRGLYVLALLTGPVFLLLNSFVAYPPSRSLSDLFMIAVLVGAVYLGRRSFRPGAERITLGRALIAAGLVPTGVVLLSLVYLLLTPIRYGVDSDGNDWGGFGALLILFFTVPVVVSSLGVGLAVRRREKRKAIAVEDSLVTGMPVPETPPVERLFFGALAVGAFLLALVWFQMFFVL